MHKSLVHRVYIRTTIEYNLVKLARNFREIEGTRVSGCYDIALEPIPQPTPTQ